MGDRTPVDEAIRAGAGVLTAAATHVADIAADRARVLAGGAVDEIRTVGEDLLSAGGDVLGQAQHAIHDIRDKTQSQIGGTVSTLRHVADQGQALAAGKRRDAGALLGRAGKQANKQAKQLRKSSKSARKAARRPGLLGSGWSFAGRHPVVLGFTVLGGGLAAFAAIRRRSSPPSFPDHRPGPAADLHPVDDRDRAPEGHSDSNGSAPTKVGADEVART